MNNKTIYWIVGVLLVIGILFWIYKQGLLAKYGLGTLRLSSTGEESMCNDTGNDPNGRISNPNAKMDETCAPPVAPQLYLVFSGGPKGDVHERKFTAQEIAPIKDLLDNYTPSFSKPTKIEVSGKEWTFNQKRTATASSPEYYLFVDNPAYRNYNDYPQTPNA